MKTMKRKLQTGLVCSQYKKANGIISIQVQEDKNIVALRKLFKTFNKV